MKKLILIPALLALLAILTSCEDEVDLNAEYKDISIVYGILDPNADTTYIRINKAFLGGDATQNVNIPDSVMYPMDLDIQVSIAPAGSNGPINLVRLNRELFYMTEEIDDQRVYDLTIKIENKLEDITSSSVVADNFEITKPQKASWEFGFATEVNYRYGFDQDIEWEIAEDCFQYEVELFFSYYELDADSNRTEKTIKWFNATRAVKPGFEMELIFASDLFYNIITNLVPYNDPAMEAAVTERLPHRIIYQVNAASEELATYIDINNNSTSILDYRPDYTNIHNGYGIFSSRVQDTLHKYLHRNMKQNLEDLGIKFVYLEEE